MKQIKKITTYVVILVVLFGMGAYVGKVYQPIVQASPNDPLETTAEVNGTVYAIEVTATKIYIGGNFTQVNGTQRNYLAALNLDGTLDTFWDPDVDDTVYAIYATASAVYAGGNFGTANSTVATRSRAAAFEIANGANTGTVTAWDPQLDDNVYAISGSGTKIYLGGAFTDVNTGTTRNSIAAVDSTTGAVDTFWNPNIDGAVKTILVNETIVYVGGDFSTVNGATARGFTAAFNLANGSDVGTALVWDPDTNGDVDVLAIYNNQIYIGGEFTEVGAELINYTARVHLTTGAIDNTWDPNPDGAVFAMVISSGGNIFLGGAFDNIGVNAHKWVALVNSSDGAVSVWDPVLTIGAIDTVYALDISDATVAVGGDFNRVNGVATHANFAQFRFPKISFSATTSSADEDDGTVSIVVSQDIASDIDLAFDVSVDEDSTASAASRFVAGDYAFADAGPYTILSGELTFNLDIEITDDETDESNETLIIDLISSDIIFLGTNTTHTLTIVDNEVFAGDITIVPTSISATEGGVTATYEATITPDAPSGETVTLTPTPNAQVTISPSSVTFSHIQGCGVCPVVLSQVFTVTAVDDAIIEGTHTGTITHTVTGDNADYNALVPSTVTVNITDNDTQTSGGGGLSSVPGFISPATPPVTPSVSLAHPLGTIINDNGTLFTITKNELSQTIRRPYTSGGAFLSYGFNSFSQVVPANSADLALPLGPFVPAQDGRVVCSDRGDDKGTCYFMTQGKKAGFSSADLFLGLGFSFANVYQGDVSFMASTENMTSSTQQHLQGTIVNNDGTIQLIGSNGLLGFPTYDIFTGWGYDDSMVLQANTADKTLNQVGLVVSREAGQIRISY